MNELWIPEAALNDDRLPLLALSYQRLTGKSLLDATPFDPLVLWNAPQAMVAHGIENDPVFFYGNRRALHLFEMSFDQFSRLPSRLSAEPMEQAVRAALLASVSSRGFVDNYSGMRISGKNNRFMINNATVWNLLDSSGTYHGQAAVFIAEG